MTSTVPTSSLQCQCTIRGWQSRREGRYAGLTLLRKWNRWREIFNSTARKNDSFICSLSEGFLAHWLFHVRTTASLVVNHNINPWSCKRSWHVLETRSMSIASLVVLTFLGNPIIRNLSWNRWKNRKHPFPRRHECVVCLCKAICHAKK